MKTLLLFLALLVPSPLLAAVAYVTPATGASSANDGAVPSIGFNFDATGMDFIIACAAVRDDGSSLGVSAFTYNAVAMTLVGAVNIEAVDDSSFHDLYMYRLNAPTAGSNPLSLVLTGTSDGIILGVMGFSGVNSTTPIGTPASYGTADGVAELSASVSPASTAADLVASCFAAFGSGAGDDTLSLGAGQTSGFSNTRAGSHPQLNGSYKIGTAGTTTMTHTDDTGFNYFGLIAVAIQPTATLSGVARRRIINQ